MKKIVELLTIAAFCVCAFSCKKEEFLKPEQVKQLSIQSQYTGSNYPIFVILPENYQPSTSYESLYVLDGDDGAIYEGVGKAAQKVSSTLNKQNIIIVAIGRSDLRWRDYAPVVQEPYSTEAGADNFIKFIELELIPKIEHEFSVDTTAKSRIIGGHSLGGTFVGYLFATHSSVFYNYMVLSPAFWWGNGAVLHTEEAKRLREKQRSSLVYVGSGELEPTITVFANEWYYRLSTFYPNCKTTQYLVPNKAHASSVLYNVEHALEFYYKNK